MQAAMQVPGPENGHQGSYLAPSYLGSAIPSQPHAPHGLAVPQEDVKGVVAHRQAAFHSIRSAVAAGVPHYQLQQS